MRMSSENLRDSTVMSSDPFSEVLRLTKAESLVTGGFRAGGRWAIQFPPPKTTKFFAVVTGRCWVCLDGEEPMQAEAGDVGLLVARRSFILASDPEVPATDAMALFSCADGRFASLGEDHDFSYIGGHVLLDSVSGPVLEGVLPPWILVRASSPEAKSFRWLLEELVKESEEELPGASLASAQLSQLLFIQILRAHLKSVSPRPASWLRALGDARLAPAVRLMHSDPARDWHLEDLARAAAMSRTGFAVHFKAVAGIPALTYLSRWRMLLAERALQDGKTSIADLAASLGYTSESAFSNAFKRANGFAPSKYREFARAEHGTK